MKNKKILLFKIGSLGDVLMTTALVRQLKKAFPRAKITYYVGKYSARILEGNKNIDKIVVFDQSIFFKKNPLQILKLRNEIAKEKFDIAFILDKHWIFGAFMKSCNIPVRIGFARDGSGKFHTASVKYKEVKHEVNYYLSLIEKLDVKPTQNTQLDMSITKKEMAFANNFFKKNKLTGKVIGIIPGGGKNPGESVPIRRWSNEKYMHLIQKLSKNYKILLIGGVEDQELNEGIIKFLNSKNIVNGTNPSLMKSSALMKKCSLIICNDSGPMHIASALTNKIISLFGPTNPVRKAPLHKESIAIWHDKDIYEEDYELYGKLPDPEKKSEWMKRISVNEVLDAVKKIL